MKRTILALLAFIMAGGAAGAQQDIRAALNFEHLKAKAKDIVDVSLDSSTLQFAGGFLSGKKGDEAKAKKLMSGLKGLFVRSFEFEKEGEYSEADLKAIRALARTPGWSRIVNIDSKAEGESTEVYTKTENGSPAGLIVIAAEKKELTVVYIDGPIDLAQLGEIGGNLGIPARRGTK